MQAIPPELAPGDRQHLWGCVKADSDISGAPACKRNLEVASAAAKLQHAPLKIRQSRQTPHAPAPTRGRGGDCVVCPGELAVEACEGPADQPNVHDRVMSYKF